MALATQTKSRTPIDLTSADRHDHTDDALRALRNWNDRRDPSIYLRGDVLVELSRDDGAAKLRPVSEPSLLELLSRTAIFTKTNARGITSQVPAASYIAKALLARTPEKLVGIPRVNRV